MTMSFKIAALALLLLAAPGCSAKEAVPKKTGASASLVLAGRVTDAADIIPAAQEAALTEKLAAFERDTRHQFVVVTVPSLKGEEIDKFTTDLGNNWGIGHAKENDGIVLLIAPNERKVRIGTGFGMREKLSDAACDRIIQQDILPRFRKGDLPGGIIAGVDKVILILRPPPA